MRGNGVAIYDLIQKQIDTLIVDDDRSLVRIIQAKFIRGGTVDAEATVLSVEAFEYRLSAD